MYPCGSFFASDVGSEPLIQQDFAKAKQLLKEAGYSTGVVGKWHLGTDDWYPESQGFDINIGGTVTPVVSKYN